MKKFFYLALIFILSSCGGNEVVEKARAQYQSYYKKILKDPVSFKVFDEKVTVKDEYIVTFIVDYGAKNSYGGLTRTTDTILVVGDTFQVNGNSIPKDAR